MSLEFKPTPHTGLKARDDFNLRALIGRKGGGRPNSLYTRRWRSKGPKKTSWIKSLHGVLHGVLWIRFYDVPKFSSRPPPRGGPNANSGQLWLFNNFFLQDRFHNILHGRFQDKQRSPSNYLKFIEFDTYYVKPSPPLSFCQQNM